MQLRIRGAQRQFITVIAGQRSATSLACSLSEPETHAIPTDTLFPKPNVPELSQAIAVELDGQAHRMRVAHDAQFSFFETEEVAFWVDVRGEFAELMRCESNADSWLFGPMLVLALARRGIYCLHASAYQQDARARLVMGHSGAGKSTLARAVQSLPGAKRLTDDITPVQVVEDVLQLLPRFPQLKLNAIDPDLPSSVCVSGLLHLRAAQPDLPLERREMNERDIYHALIRHTVATRLFSERDTRQWWQQLPSMARALAHTSDALRPSFDVITPERAMLDALKSLRGSGSQNQIVEI